MKAGLLHTVCTRTSIRQVFKAIQIKKFRIVTSEFCSNEEIFRSRSTFTWNKEFQQLDAWISNGHTATYATDTENAS
jgi:hypothetical protein